MDTKPNRPLPEWDADTEGFWKGAHDHVLLVKRCKQCGYASFPQFPACHNCSAMDMEWVPSSGKGHIFTWTTVYRSTRPEFVDDVPFTLAVVELDDYEVRLPGRLKGVEPLQAKIGDPVEVRFEDLTDEVSLYYWVPANG